VPVRRTGVPDDIAAAVSFIASDGTSFINGARLIVNGGMTLD
jgi:3-oxoacyl-[acyl-carrier protein] reductase